MVELSTAELQSLLGGIAAYNGGGVPNYAGAVEATYKNMA